MSNINLLPWRAKKIIYKNYLFGAICGVVTIVIVLIFLDLISISKMIMLKINKEMQYINSEMNIYAAKSKEANLIKSRQKVLIEQLTVLDNLKFQRLVVLNVLEQVARSVPKGMVLQDVGRKSTVFASLVGFGVTWAVSFALG